MLYPLRYQLTEAGKKLAKKHQIPFDDDDYIHRSDLKTLTKLTP